MQRKYFIVDFKAPPYKPNLPLLYCSCNHPRCNGRYIQCYDDQNTCLWSYWEIEDYVETLFIINKVNGK